MVRRGAVALMSWATATVAASVVSVAGISLVTSQVTRAPLPAASEAETAPPASRATAATVAAPVTTHRQESPRVASEPAEQIPTPAAATFGSLGGVVTARCDGDVIALSSASPASGYRLSIVATGPDAVEVDFEGPQPTRTRLVCADGHPVQQGGAERPGTARDERGRSAQATAARDTGRQGPWGDPWDVRWEHHEDDSDHRGDGERRDERGAGEWDASGGTDRAGADRDAPESNVDERERADGGPPRDRSSSEGDDHGNPHGDPRPDRGRPGSDDDARDHEDEDEDEDDSGS